MIKCLPWSESSVSYWIDLEVWVTVHLLWNQLRTMNSTELNDFCACLHQFKNGATPFNQAEPNQTTRFSKPSKVLNASSEWHFASVLLGFCISILKGIKILEKFLPSASRGTKNLEFKNFILETHCSKDWETYINQKNKLMKLL